MAREYKDQILDTSVNTKRVYNIVDSDGNIVAENISFEDKTVYSQEGTEFGAQEVNEIYEAIDEVNSSLVNAGSAKYNAETDSLDIYYNGELVGSLRCGFKGFNVLKTLNSDWTLTSDSNSKATGLTTTITESNAKFVTTWSIGAMNTYFAYIRYAKESIDLTNLSTIKFVASFSGSGGGINFGISLVNKNTGARTTVFNKNTGSAYSASCNENIDITGYSGEYYIELFTNSSSNPYPSITVTSLYLE